MKLEWLEDILAVAETGSFTEAAERRYLTQSAFSRRIQQIEEYVGVELFDRRSKPVRLCPTTENQREHIADLIGLLRQLVIDLRLGAKTSANQVVIASQHALTATLAPTIINRAQSCDPNTSVKVRSANLDECLTMLLSRRVDVALLYRLPGSDHPVRPDFVETMTIGSDRLVPTIGRSRVDWLEENMKLKHLPLIVYPAEVFLGQVLEITILSRLRREFQLSPKAETALTFAAIEMAMSGFALAWVPFSLARDRIEGGSLIELSDRLPEVDLEITAVRLVGPCDPPQQAMWTLFKLLQANDPGMQSPVPQISV
jgi:DNA-binding transcriptional LysR family regulator